MIKRLVKLTLTEDNSENFRQLFNSIRERIEKFDGCTCVELWKDTAEPGVFFTYSEWISEDHLNEYRKSSFFRKTWQVTKTFFRLPAEAWSVEQSE